MTIGLIANNDGTGAVQLGGSNAISLDTSLNATMAGYVNAPNTFGFKNRIINGGMQIDQRNNGAAATLTDGVYTLDRWRAFLTQLSKYTLQQNAGAVTPPSGFTNYLGVTSSSAYNVQASDYFMVGQAIEGLNTADLAWGTASAHTVTLSFRVYSSLTGTFGGALQNQAQTRAYPFTYSIPVANTWTTISITIPGDTTGTWLTTNGIGLLVRFSLGMGSTFSGTAGAWAAAGYYSATGAVSVVGTSGATFYITGVQLEKGSTATSYDVRDYGRELIMCQRYFQTDSAFQQPATAYYMSNYGGTNAVYPLSQLPVVMRTTPTITFTNAAAQYYSYAGVWTNTTVTGGSYSPTSIFILASTDGDGRGKLLRPGSAGTAPAPYYLANGEL